MTPPLVSIILPTYNRAGLLAGAIDSCLKQTYANIEVIVVDDGSKDETPDVAGRFARKDPRVRYVRQENQKLPATLNTGHRAARGDYFSWSSDDNRYDPDAIEIMVEYLEANPRYGLVYCDYRLVDGDGNTIQVRGLPGPENILETPAVGACFLYRREVYVAVGEYDRTAFLAEDYDYWVRVGKMFEVAHLPGIAPYAFLRHGGSLSDTRRPDVILQNARARARHTPSPARARQVLADGHFDASFWYCQQGDLLRSLKCSAISIGLDATNPRNYKWFFGIFKHSVGNKLSAGRGRPGPDRLPPERHIEAGTGR